MCMQKGAIMDLVLILLPPILMILDYSLTMKSANMVKGKYSEHFSVEQFELNPVWQEDVSKAKKFNIKHLIMVLIAAGLAYSVVKLSIFDEWSSYFVLGIIIIPYATIVGRHISNILTFKYVENYSDTLHGKLIVDYIYTLKLSQHMLIGNIFVLSIIYICTFSSFILGGILGYFSLYVSHSMWKGKYKKKKKDN